MRWFYINGTASLCRRRILFVPRLGCSELKPDEGTLLATLTGEVSFAHATKIGGQSSRNAESLAFGFFYVLDSASRSDLFSDVGGTPDEPKMDRAW